MLLANYASDSEGSEDESGSSRPLPLPTAPTPAPATTTTTAKPKRKGPVKITLDLPKSSTGTVGVEGGDDGGKLSPGEERGGKRAKLGSTGGGAGGIKGGKGSSALLGMLPPPKRKLPASKTTPAPSASLAVNKSMATSSIRAKPAANLPAPPGYVASPGEEEGDSDSDDEGSGDKMNGQMLPPALQRQAQAQAKAKSTKVKEPSLDLFGLEPTPSSSSASTSKITKPPSMSISSAPAVADFIPPPPGPNDPYPGYYQLPSGEWAAYEQDYYHSFFPPSTADEEGDGRVGRHWEEYNSKGADYIDVDVSKGLEEGRAERERRERATKPKTGEEVEYKAVGQIKGLATERHQLSALLNTAFTQKEELEQRIANNKKSARMASQKYGF